MKAAILAIFDIESGQFFNYLRILEWETERVCQSRLRLMREKSKFEVDDVNLGYCSQFESI